VILSSTVRERQVVHTVELEIRIIHDRVL
jgi:hypothetical protein